MSHKVKILDFERKAIRVGDAQQILERYLDEGYTIAGVCEANGFVTYTLVLTVREYEKELPPLFATIQNFHDTGPIRVRGEINVH